MQVAGTATPQIRVHWHTVLAEAVPCHFVSCRRADGRSRVLRYNLTEEYVERTDNETEYNGPELDCDGGVISSDW